MVAVLKVMWYLSWRKKSAHRKCWWHLRQCWLHAEVLIFAWLKTKIVQCKSLSKWKKHCRRAGVKDTCRNAKLQIAACFANSQPRDINWSCEICELRSFHCLEFSFLVFHFHGWLLLSLQWREVEGHWRPSKLAKPNWDAWIRWQYIVLFWNISWCRRDLYFQRYLEGSFHCLPLLRLAF